jgi:hypothetical protein
VPERVFCPSESRQDGLPAFPFARTFPRTTAILHFEESYVGGFFRFARTYGAVARFEADSVETLEADWPAAVRETSEWRNRRGDQALSLHLHVVVPRQLAWDGVAFLAGKLLTSAAVLPEEFTGLRVEALVLATPGMEVYLGMTLNSEATGRGGGA